MATETRDESVFARDKFLLRQQHLAIREKYHVSDEHGEPILFIERPRHMFRGILGILLGVLAVVPLAYGLFTAIAAIAPGPVRDILAVAAVLAVIAVFVTIALAVSKKRHLTIYRDATKAHPLLQVQQDRKFQPIRATYTVVAADGDLLAHFEKNYLFDLFRKRWHCFGPHGELLAVVKEDSPALALLRRVLGPLFGILRTNFRFFDPETGVVIGEFNRKFTILDRYVLDFTADPGFVLDRRIALALGIMLDTGERR